MSVLTVSSLHSQQGLLALFGAQPDGVVFKDAQWQAASGSEAATDAVLTVYAPALTLSQLAGITQALEGTCDLHGFTLHPLSGKFHEVVVKAPVTVLDESALKPQLEAIAAQYYVDIVVQHNQPELARPGLLVMDMDSTIIQIECIDEIAKLAGLGEKVAEVTARAMRGELAFSESLISRVACLKGVPVAQLAQIRDSIPLMPGVVPLIAELKAHGWKIAIASGGFTYFAAYVKERLGLDAAYSNTLKVDGDVLAGEVVGEIVDADVKARRVASLADEWQIPMSQTVAMGDGANDLVMMAKAALGVACHAKPLVREKADTAIRYSGLQGMLYLLK
ncbi:phosphoserine phosphatase SerB [Alteromonas confluentis]|uniref:Phosphoserine phosphatase n=1 Tax=Alteromonas confluentis TaxID=1656094 RepID=A0A1E7Z7U1_9ALTE|nr:phosphoserine phosphatase SerB [Alteromonas confluentis]OFC69547.1 phosphoserine phosphatase SerB [Alteromonas confluentis]